MYIVRIERVLHGAQTTPRRFCIAIPKSLFASAQALFGWDAISLIHPFKSSFPSRINCRFRSILALCTLLCGRSLIGFELFSGNFICKGGFLPGIKNTYVSRLSGVVQLCLL